MARPSKFSDGVATKICERIAEGESLRAICRDAKMPSEGTVRGWVVDDELGKPWSGFSARYARAREMQADHFSGEILEIADEMDDDDSVAVQRARLRVDTRKWLMSKMAPKRYGDATRLVAGTDDSPGFQGLVLIIPGGNPEAEV